MELGVSDETGTRRRMMLSSSFTEAKCTPLHCQIPFTPVARDAWLNLVLALGELCPCMFRGIGFRSLDTLTIGGSCRVRRVFTLRDVAASDGMSLQVGWATG